MRNRGAKPWTLKEALARTASRKALIALQETRAASPADPKDGEAIRADIVRLLAEASTLTKDGDASAVAAIREQVRCLEDQIEVEGERWHELDDARAAIQKALQTAMAAGRAAGFGSIDAKSCEKTPIPAEAWRSAYVDWEASAMSFGRGNERTHLVGVEVHPWLHLNDAAARLDGLPLKTAFRRFVLDDPELAAIVDRASWCSFWPSNHALDELGPYDCICNLVLEGKLTADDPLWPASLDEYDLAVEWMSAKPRRFADLAPADRRKRLDWLEDIDDEAGEDFKIVRQAERVVRDRFDRFMTFLRDGRLIARGRPCGHAEPVVSQAIWDRPTTRIDFVNGEVLCAASDGPPEREWTGLMLSLARAQEVTPVPAVEREKGKGGTPVVHLWSEMFERLSEKLETEGHPENGAGLATMALSCFEEMKVLKPPDPSTVRKELKAWRPRLWATLTARSNRHNRSA